MPGVQMLVVIYMSQFEFYSIKFLYEFVLLSFSGLLSNP
jgi:hypothetical protein